MKEKYWVPALERADDIITTIAKNPKKLKLMELSEKTKINKSSLFSLLNTLDALGWIYKEANQTYSLGPKLGFFSAKYTQQFDLTKYFEREADKVVMKINETIQLSIRQGKKIVYIAKKESSQRVRIVSEPGMTLPAHATAMGKALLSELSDHKLLEMYENKKFEKITNNTVDNINQLLDQVNYCRKEGYIVEHQETIEGFTCIAAPILNENNKIIAAVSFTMTNNNWEKKKNVLIEEILNLAKKISNK